MTTGMIILLVGFFILLLCYAGSTLRVRRLEDDLAAAKMKERQTYARNVDLTVRLQQPMKPTMTFEEMLTSIPVGSIITVTASETLIVLDEQVFRSVNCLNIFMPDGNLAWKIARWCKIHKNSNWHRVEDAFDTTAKHRTLRRR
jgi:hypothetical protein